MPLEHILNSQEYYITFFLLWQAAKPITTLNNQNCANILVNMEYILYLCVIIQI